MGGDGGGGGGQGRAAAVPAAAAAAVRARLQERPGCWHHGGEDDPTTRDALYRASSPAPAHRLWGLACVLAVRICKYEGELGIWPKVGHFLLQQIPLFRGTHLGFSCN